MLFDALMEGRTSIWKSPLPGPNQQVYFTNAELRDPETDEISLDGRFARDLVNTRIDFDDAMNVTSGCRSLAYNISIKGHPHSLHVWDQPFHAVRACAAADISIHNWSLKKLVRFIHIGAGHSLSMGINTQKKFIHIDGRVYAGLPQHMFFYNPGELIWPKSG